MLPYLDLANPGFSTRSQAVHKAREQNWCARTPFGLAVLRHREAGELLKDRRLRQGSYAWPQSSGLTGSFAEFWSRSVISMEGQSHKDLRQIAMSALSPEFLESKRRAFETIATRLAIALPKTCDFMEHFAHPFSGQAIATVLNLPQDKAEGLANDASALGLAMGLDCLKYQDQFNAACDRLMTLSDDLLRRARAGQDQSGLVNALAMSKTDDEALRDLIVIMIFGGVDTTRGQLGFAISLFAQHPKQWTLLQQDPKLIPNAIEEIIRHRPTTTWATREVIEDFDHKGVALSKGQTVHVLVHASALDPLAGGPPGFDITQRRKGHFGFGGGAHHCLGQAMARMDIAAALGALSQHIKHFDITKGAEFLPDSGNTSAKYLPVRLSFHS